MAETTNTPNAGNTPNQNTTPSTGAAPAVNASNVSANQPSGAPDVSKSPDAGATTAEPTKAGKYTLAYIGGGIWTDQSGQMWCKDEHRNCIQTKTFSKKELADRPDIEWMVEYGAMRKTEV